LETEMKTCPECGAKFEPEIRHPHQIYCTNKCGEKARHKRRYKHKLHPKDKCIVCGKTFEKRKETHRFCSGKCRNSYNNSKTAKEKRTVRCVVCGKEFQVIGNRVAKYCSSECRWKPSKRISASHKYKMEGELNGLFCEACKKPLRGNWKRLCLRCKDRRDKNLEAHNLEGDFIYFDTPAKGEFPKDVLNATT